MSEFWKSTPRYLCKFCKIHVPDNKFERQRHEASFKHQNNIQRSLRELHRNQEREQREKQRAKDEVARLNGVVTAPSASSSPSVPPWKRKGASAPSATGKQATAEERKRQMAQLAEMGVAIPDEFRREMAMAGDWQTLAETPVLPGVKNDEEDVKPEARSIGVRKRKLEGQDEAEEAGETAVRKGWGSTLKTYPGSKGAEEDLEALLSGTKAANTESKPVNTEPTIKKEESVEGSSDTVAPAVNGPDPAVKTEAAVKPEDGATGTGIVFKKRKTKAIRQT